jgi:hypothetical protein
MPMTSMNVSLPQELKDYIEQQMKARPATARRPNTSGSLFGKTRSAAPRSASTLSS